jgi:hypothetical protein
VRHTIAGGAEVADAGRGLSQLEQRLASLARELGRVAVFRREVFGHGPLF